MESKKLYVQKSWSPELFLQGGAPQLLDGLDSPHEYYSYRYH